MSDLTAGLLRQEAGIAEANRDPELAVILREAADTIERLTKERDEARAAAFEEAAKIADKHNSHGEHGSSFDVWDDACERIGLAIRAAAKGGGDE